MKKVEMAEHFGSKKRVTKKERAMIDLNLQINSLPRNQQQIDKLEQKIFSEVTDSQITPAAEILRAKFDDPN